MTSPRGRGAESPVEARPFELPTVDGEVLRGEVRSSPPAPASAVVVLHGFKGFRRWGFFPHVCERLARDGHAVVSFDFSRNGVGPAGEEFDELEAFARNTFSRELDEAHRVVRALREGTLPVDPPLTPPRQVGLLGHSRGGATAILAAAEGGVDALATWAAIRSFRRWDEATIGLWRREGRLHIHNARTGQEMPLDVSLLDDLEANRERLDIAAAATRVSVPWLIVHGTDDESVPVEEANGLKRATADAELAIVDGAGHTFGATHPFEGEGPLLAAALERTAAHFRHLEGARS